MDPSNQTVAVVGAGPAGLAALKYLRDEGFKVTVFERRGDVGGIWTFSGDPDITSTTPNYPLHLNSTLWSEYYLSYAKHFDLYPHIEFNVHVETIGRDSARNKWAIHLKGEREPRLFDKAVMATGSEHVPLYPDIEGLDLFKGLFLHAQSYKDPAPFADQTVLVIGQGASTGDTCVDLAEKSKVYFSHRRGLKICPRVAKDGPLDSILTFRFSRITNWLGHYALFLYGIILDAAVRKNVREAFGEIDPAWGFEPSPSLSNGVSAMMINDHMIALIREGKVSPVTGVKRVTGPKEVELTDGRTLKDIDVIIACTGYKPCNHIVEGLSYTTLDDRVGPLPDLYQNMFPITHADSLVFLDYCVISENAATYREIMAMAVAQIWAGKSKLPSADKMQADVREYQRWFTTKKLDWSATTPGLGRAHTFLRFIHDAAGTGTDEYLGWGWKGWKLWWTDRKLYNLAAWGLYSPHIYRIFETGKRPVWSGAREALLRINEIYRKDWGKGGKMKAERSQGVCTE